jgi:hypothetical protein
LILATDWGATDWLAVAAVAQVVVLLFAALYARRQVREARSLRAVQTRPYVVVYFETSRVARHLIDLVVENIGQTPALNVSISFSPRLETTLLAPAGQDRANDWVALSEGIPYLAPRQRMMHLLESAIARYNSESKLPRRYEVTVSYSEVATRGRQVADHSERYVLDIGVWYGSHYVTEKGLHDVGDALEDMAKTFKAWTEDLNGLRVYAVDWEKHRAERDAWIEERIAGQRAQPLQEDQQAEDPG